MMSDDHGAPISFLALRRGTPVLTSDGTRIGTVEHVLSHPEANLFDGIVVDTRLGPGGHRFVDAPEVASIAERAVTLTLDAAQAARLPKPGASPAELSAGPGDAPEGELTRKLRRAWDLLSGRS
jgi:uncharacterized protein YrrD